VYLIKGAVQIRIEGRATERVEGIDRRDPFHHGNLHHHRDHLVRDDLWVMPKWSVARRNGDNDIDPRVTRETLVGVDEIFVILDKMILAGPHARDAVIRAELDDDDVGLEIVTRRELRAVPIRLADVLQQIRS
jgi:hypothetical protein